MARYRILEPHLHDQVPLATVATTTSASYRTLQRWLAAYRRDGLTGLAQAGRSDRGRRTFPQELVDFIEGMALRQPRPSVATIHRHAQSIAAARGWPVPAYRTVHDIVSRLDPALTTTLAHHGPKRYREVYDLVYRREATKPNEIWQADHTELDIWVIDDKGKPDRPWLTAIEDDHSRAIAGYAVNLEAPSALTTALAFRHAIWRKAEPSWHVCGIPSVFHLDHGTDFTSAHLEQVMADLKVTPVFTLKGQLHGHGKIERLIGTVNQMCLAHLPGYAPRGTPDRAAQAKLTLPELDAAIGRFFREVYNLRPHSETKMPPQARWEAGAFIPRMPDSLQQLDLLLLTVAKPRKIHTDGIHFLSLRYLDPVLAFYVNEQATIRYDPRDITEIRVYLRTPDGGEEFLCRAICPELAGTTISLKEITAARNARRKELRGRLTSRSAVVDRLLAAHQEPLPAAYATTGLANWQTGTQPAGEDAVTATQTAGPPAEPLTGTDADATRRDAPRLKRYWNERAVLGADRHHGVDPTDDASPGETPDPLPDPASRSDPQAADAGPGNRDRPEISDRPEPPSPASDPGNGHAPIAVTIPIVITKEHRLFIEFADAVRRERYVGLCFGAPGVGKTESARYYSKWDQLAHHLDGTRPAGSDGSDTSAAQILAARAVMYTPKVHNTPHNLDKEISYLCDRLGWNVEIMLNPGRGVDEHGMLNSSTHAELLIVDEADRLRTAALEQLRDHHDRTGIGLILIGMPGIEKRLARYPQLYSRVGFVHHYKPMSANEQAFVLARSWPHLRLGDTDDYASTEAVAAITRITSGNFRLTVRLIGQIERVMKINNMSVVTKEIVDAARENLVTGAM